MANGVKVTLHYKGFESIRKSSETQSECLSIAKEIASRAHSNSVHKDAEYEASVVDGRNRAHASVITGNFMARLDNGAHNTLMKSIYG